MNTLLRSHRLIAPLGFLIAIGGAASAHAAPFSIKCNTGGDALGWSVATGGDFDGDGVDDIVMGGPCAVKGRGLEALQNAGRVMVASGRTGKVLLRRQGKQIGQFMGTSVAFVGDLNRDGKDEIVVGSPGWDIEEEKNPDPLGGNIINAGKIEVITSARRVRYAILGQDREGGFGETVASIDDLDGDGRPDILVGAPNEHDASGGRKGLVHLLSGRNGAELTVRAGLKRGSEFGRALTVLPDTDGDGMPDVVAGSPEMNVNGVQNSGLVSVFSGDLSGQPLLEQQGARNDKIGVSVDRADDRDNDGRDEFIVGSAFADNTGVVQAGEVGIYDVEGNLLLQASDPIPQEKAHFGSAVANVGDITGDLRDDYVVGAPDNDVIISKSNQITDSGRVVAIDGANGQPVWALESNRFNAALGFSVAGGGFLFNNDPTPDPIVGSKGDTPQGKRGAGSVRILSGTTGELLRMYRGVHGLETRLFMAGPSDLIGFDVEGTPRNPRALVGLGGRMSVAVIDDEGVPVPGEVLLAVAGGEDAPVGNVLVFDAGKADDRITSFDALADAVPIDPEGDRIRGGVNISAGRLVDDDFGDRIVAVQADSTDGNVLLRVFRRFSDTDRWFLESEFAAFNSSDEFEISPTVFEPIAAKGATVAVGDVLGGRQAEIVVGATRGLPVVRVFNTLGQILAEWLAYEPVSNRGVRVCAGDLSGGTNAEILTVPDNGVPLIKAFDGNGNRSVIPNSDGAVIEFLPDVSSSFVGGGTACASDVDYDTEKEIVYLAGTGTTPLMQAFELDGTPVEGFVPFEVPGNALAPTDTFVRK